MLSILLRHENHLPLSHLAVFDHLGREIQPIWAPEGRTAYDVSVMGSIAAGREWVFQAAVEEAPLTPGAIGGSFGEREGRAARRGVI